MTIVEITGETVKAYRSGEEKLFGSVKTCPYWKTAPDAHIDVLSNDILAVRDLVDSCVTRGEPALVAMTIENRGPHTAAAFGAVVSALLEECSLFQAIDFHDDGSGSDRSVEHIAAASEEVATYMRTMAD